jgi:NDMA-dependent alcohol dehydrogenase
MKCKAAILWEQPGQFEICEIDLDPPGRGEVLLQMQTTGLCHSDDHFPQNDLKVHHLPFCSGHEGAGVIESTGPEVDNLKPGDRVVTVFIPSCGRCPMCVAGLQNLCDNGAKILEGSQLDGTYRMHANGVDVGQNGLISTFSEYSVVPAISCIRVPDDVPMKSACLAGCAVPTGWGGAVNLAGLRPGDVAIVIGIGGVGANALQGCRHMSASTIIAVDPVPFKREMARVFGATHSVATIDEASEIARELTNGQGADAAIVSVGLTTGEHIAQAFSAIRKAGTVVSTGVSGQVGIPVNLVELAFYQKRIQGNLYGGVSPLSSVPRIYDLYLRGELLLDELVTKIYSLDEINAGYDDMRAGLNIRGVIEFSR